MKHVKLVVLFVTTLALMMFVHESELINECRYFGIMTTPFNNVKIACKVIE